MYLGYTVCRNCFINPWNLEFV